MRRVFILICFLLGVTEIFGQHRVAGTNDRIFPGAPLGYRFDGDIREWKGLEYFVPGESFYSTTVWMRSTPAGLLIAGERLTRGSRVELTLAGPHDVLMPEPGSLGRFGFTTFASEAGCQHLDSSMRSTPDECLAWYRKNIAHQQVLAQLFLRRYVIAPESVTETLASAAWEKIGKDMRVPAHLKRHPLQPDSLPRLQKAGEAFEIEIPWSAFPPIDTMPLSEFRWRLQVYHSSQQEDYENPVDLRRAILMTPRKYQFSQCEYGLRSYPDSELDQSWFRPGDHLLIHDIVTLNYPLNFFWEPQGLTPVIKVMRTFEEQLEPGVWFCGPIPAQKWRQQTSMAEIPEFRWRGGMPAPGNYRKQRLPDGRWLIVGAPEQSDYGYFGGGQCGGCVVWTVHVWRLSAAGIELLSTFESDRMDHDGVRDWDIHFGTDLRFANLYSRDGDPPQWTRQRLCYGAKGYDACGPAQQQAPVRRVTKSME